MGNKRDIYDRRSCLRIIRLSYIAVFLLGAIALKVEGTDLSKAEEGVKNCLKDAPWRSTDGGRKKSSKKMA